MRCFVPTDKPGRRGDRRRLVRRARHVYTRDMPAQFQLLLIPGSLRAGSSNVAALNTARALLPTGWSGTLYAGLGGLPHFNPDVEQADLPVQVIELRALLRAADAVLFSTPEYAGGLPGSFKNLLDWTVGEGLYRKPVGWLNASPHDAGASASYAMLRSVLGYVSAEVVDAACVRAPVRRDRVGPDGLVQDEQSRGVIASAVHALVEHVEHVEARPATNG